MAAEQITGPELSHPRPIRGTVVVKPFLIFCLCAIPLAIGCGTFSVPQDNIFLGGSSQSFGPNDMGFDAGIDDAETLYHAVRQARGQGSMVLQVVGDSQPARTLPLPPGGQAVYLSQMLDQTGVAQKLGAMDVMLFRYSDQMPGGLRMKVTMDKDGGRVQPASDYALQPGDRVRVRPLGGSKMLDGFALGS